MTKTQRMRSQAAKKANKTRRARRELVDRYGFDTSDIADLAMKGHSCSEISEQLLIPVASVAATVANMNRPGRLSDLVEDCNF